jgi:hypothetical protein
MTAKVRPVLFGALIAMTITASATAQSFKLPTVAFLVAAAGDWTTTAVDLAAGASEVNPVLKPFHNAPIATVAAGAAIDVAGLHAWTHFVGKRHPKIATTGLYMAAAFRAYLAIRNMRTPNIIWR